MKKTTLKILAAIVLLAVLSACSVKTADTSAAATEITPAGSLVFEGRLYPVNNLDHSFDLSGQVAEVLVKDGDTVQVGQPLARLATSPELDLALARAEQDVLSAQQALDTLQQSADSNLANARLAVILAQEAVDKAQTVLDGDNSAKNQALLDIAKSNLAVATDTARKLESGNGLNPDQRASAEALLASAEAALKSAQSAQDALTLKANIPGTVVDLSLQPGQKVAAGNPLMTIADYSTWVVKTDNLTEMDVVNVKIGQTVKVVLDAMPGKMLTGEVTHINARYEEKRGDITYTVTIQLSQSDPDMRWGMTASVNFQP